MTMATDCDKRLAHLEFRADAHDKEITSLRDSQQLFSKSLQAIEQTLLQIKWALYGGGLVFTLSNFGLKDVLFKYLLH